MNVYKSSWLSALAMLAVFSSAVINASPVTFQFSGHVTDYCWPNLSSDSFQCDTVGDDPLDGSVGIGTMFSGSYTFDLSMAN